MNTKIFIILIAILVISFSGCERIQQVTTPDALSTDTISTIKIGVIQPSGYYTGSAGEYVTAAGDFVFLVVPPTPVQGAVMAQFALDPSELNATPLSSSDKLIVHTQRALPVHLKRIFKNSAEKSSPVKCMKLAIKPLMRS